METPLQTRGAGSGSSGTTNPLGGLFPHGNQAPRSSTTSPQNSSGSPAASHSLISTLSTPPKLYDDETLRKVSVRELQAQVRDLEARRTVLRSELAAILDSMDSTTTPTTTNTSTTSAPSQTTIPPPPSKPTPTTLLSSYRITAGITSFTLRSPNPPHSPLYGFRIDTYSATSSSYLAPHYIICTIHPLTHTQHSPTTATSTSTSTSTAQPQPQTSFLVLKHATVPPHVNLQALARKHLPLPPGYDAGGRYIGTNAGADALGDSAALGTAKPGPTWKQDPKALVAEARTRIVWWNRRAEMFRRIKLRCVVSAPPHDDQLLPETPLLQLGRADDDEMQSDDDDDGDGNHMHPRKRSGKTHPPAGEVMLPPTHVEWDAGNENLLVEWAGSDGRGGKTALEARVRVSMDGGVVKCVVRRGGERVRLVERRLRVAGLKVLGA